MVSGAWLCVCVCVIGCMCVDVWYVVGMCVVSGEYVCGTSYVGVIGERP